MNTFSSAQKAAGFPRFVIRVFKTLYQNNDIFIVIEGQVFHFLTVLAGVLQGCPGSGNLFLVALNLVLVAITRLLEAGEHLGPVRLRGRPRRGIEHIQTTQKIVRNIQSR